MAVPARVTTSAASCERGMCGDCCVKFASVRPLRRPPVASTALSIDPFSLSVERRNPDWPNGPRRSAARSLIARAPDYRLGLALQPLPHGDVLTEVLAAL